MGRSLLVVCSHTARPGGIERPRVAWFGFGLGLGLGLVCSSVPGATSEAVHAIPVLPDDAPAARCGEASTTCTA